MTATWTTPRTWATGEVVTESMLNTHVRDNLDWLKEAHAEQRAEVHGLDEGEHLLGSKHGAYRLEVKAITITANAQDGNFDGNGAWANAFGDSVLSVALALVSAVTSKDPGRNLGYIESFSPTGFTARLAVSGGAEGDFTFHVWGLGKDA